MSIAPLCAEAVRPRDKRAQSVEKSHGRKDIARENIGVGEPLFSRAVELWRLFSAFAQAFEVALAHIDHAFRIFLLDEFFRLLFVERKCR